MLYLPQAGELSHQNKIEIPAVCRWVHNLIWCSPVPACMNMEGASSSDASSLASSAESDGGIDLAWHGVWKHPVQSMALCPTLDLVAVCSGSSVHLLVRPSANSFACTLSTPEPPVLRSDRLGGRASCAKKQGRMRP